MVAAFETNVIQAVFTALNGNITGDLYDEVPPLPDGQPNANFPYTVIGESAAAPMDTDDQVGREVTVTIHVWSRYEGTKEIRAIMDEIFGILHRSGTDLSTDDHAVIDTQVEYSEIFREPNARHAVMRARVTVQYERWILADGVWEDDGRWVDTAVWIDGA